MQQYPHKQSIARGDHGEEERGLLSDREGVSGLEQLPRDERDEISPKVLWRYKPARGALVCTATWGFLAGGQLAGLIMIIMFRLLGDGDKSSGNS